MGRRAFVVALVFVTLLTGRVLGASEQPQGALDPGRVAWRRLQLTAKKIGISATMEVRLTVPDAATVADPPGQAARTAGDGPGTVSVESSATFAGRTLTAVERVDAATATASEIVDTETGAKNHRKLYRLTPKGFLFDLREPASGREADLGVDAWTEQTRTFIFFPAGLPAGAAVTGPNALLYAASAGTLAAPGDTMSFYVLVKSQVERVTLLVKGLESVVLDFEERSGERVSRVQGPVDVVRVALRSEPVDPKSASSFHLFGLEGDIEILWEPQRRVPVEVTGQVKLLGHVAVKLMSATLK